MRQIEHGGAGGNGAGTAGIVESSAPITGDNGATLHSSTLTIGGRGGDGENGAPPGVIGLSLLETRYRCVTD